MSVFVRLFATPHARSISYFGAEYSLLKTGRETCEPVERRTSKAHQEADPPRADLPRAVHCCEVRSSLSAPPARRTCLALTRAGTAALIGVALRLICNSQPVRPGQTLKRQETSTEHTPPHRPRRQGQQSCIIGLLANYCELVKASAFAVCHVALPHAANEERPHTYMTLQAQLGPRPRTSFASPHPCLPSWIDSLPAVRTTSTCDSEVQIPCTLGRPTWLYAVAPCTLCQPAYHLGRTNATDLGAYLTRVPVQISANSTVCVPVLVKRRALQVWLRDGVPTSARRGPPVWPRNSTPPSRRSLNIRRLSKSV